MTLAFGIVYYFKCLTASWKTTADSAFRTNFLKICVCNLIVSSPYFPQLQMWRQHLSPIVNGDTDQKATVWKFTSVKKLQTDSFLLRYNFLVHFSLYRTWTFQRQVRQNNWSCFLLYACRMLIRSPNLFLVFTKLLSGYQPHQLWARHHRFVDRLRHNHRRSSTLKRRQIGSRKFLCLTHHLQPDGSPVNIFAAKASHSTYLLYYSFETRIFLLKIASNFTYVRLSFCHLKLSSLKFCP
jgi:hypothetical protein